MQVELRNITLDSAVATQNTLLSVQIAKWSAHRLFYVATSAAFHALIALRRSHRGAGRDAEIGARAVRVARAACASRSACTGLRPRTGAPVARGGGGRARQSAGRSERVPVVAGAGAQAGGGMVGATALASVARQRACLQRALRSLQV